MKRNKRRIEYTLKKSLSIIISVIIIASSLNLPGFNGLFKGIALDTHAKSPINNRVKIDSLRELYVFARDYSSATSRTEIIIKLNNIEISPSMDFDGETIYWNPIGTEADPFGGKVTFNITAGSTQNIAADVPIFGCIMDSVDLVNINKVDNVEQRQQIKLIRNTSVGDGETKPLFANHVVHDSADGASPAIWDIEVGGTGTYSGIIGTVGTGLDTAKATINLTLGSSAAIQGADNVGLVCGTIQKDSSVTVNFTQGGTADNSQGNMYEGDPLELIEEEMEEEPEAEPEEESEEQPEEQSEVQPEEQSEVQPEEQPEEQSEVQPEEQSEVQPEEQSEVQPEEQSEVQPEEQSEVQPEEQSEVQPEEQSEVQPEEQQEEFNGASNKTAAGKINETVVRLTTKGTIGINREEFVGEPGEQTNEETTEEVSEETQEEVSEETQEEVSEETKEEASEETKEEISEETKEETSEETKEETSEETKEETSEESSEKAPKDADTEDNDRKATVSNITSITSSSACAGGFVGQMYENSTLLIVTNGLYDISSSSRTITGGTYAGGLVGYNDQGTVKIKQTSSGSEVVYDALGTIIATDDAADNVAGGVFGYYKISSTYNKFSPDYYKSTTGCNLNAKTAGALVGKLDADGIDVDYSGTDATTKVTVKSNLSAAGTTYGGIVGSYSNTSLEKSFTTQFVAITMQGKEATNYGGVIGKLAGQNEVYVKADNITVSSTCGSLDKCSYFGGAVGTTGDKGSFIDLGTITVTTSSSFSGGGVVGQLKKGVLRLSGITNLSGAAASSGGQLVGERIDALVYALGSGENADTSSYESGWRFVRSTTDAAVDDIGTWGEVLRIEDVETGTPAVIEPDPENPDADPIEVSAAVPAVITYDSTKHTATVASAVTNMRSTTDIVRTSLNMQLNDGSDVGALCFADKTNTTTSSRRDQLLANKNLTIFGTINLEDTGITGFMRDGYSSSADSEIKFFTGKLSKGEADEGEEDADAVIQLAIGERYGIYTAGSDVDATGRGAIHTHGFNGLFARTGEGAGIENITVGGFINLRTVSDSMYVGGAIAYLRNGATLTSVNASETINYYHSSGTSHYVGGLVGAANCDAGKNVTIEGADSETKALIKPTITVKGSLLDNDNTSVKQSVGGLIAYISSTATATTTVQHITLTATVDASSPAGVANVSTAGLISNIAWNATDTRTLVLNDISVVDTVIKNKSTSNTGGILGYRWFGTDVTFDEVVLSSDEGSCEINSTALYVGGLVYKATGRWVVNSGGITINSLDIKNGSSTATPNGLGIIVHDGYAVVSSVNYGLFLEFNSENSYSLSSGLSHIPTMTGKIYDELCACLSNSADNILLNGKSGVISYYTSNGVYTSAEGTKNSYDNVYNSTVVNNRSRYYYNADSGSYINYESDDGYKLLYWSLNRYAAPNIKRCFSNPYTNNVLSGTYDLKNISYYPIDIGENVSISDATFVFYNTEIEETEMADDTRRSTRATTTTDNVTRGNSQHYMMHMGLFKDVTHTITTTGNINFIGSVGVNSVYSGSFICGKLTGKLDTAASGKTINIGSYYNGENLPLEISDNTQYLFINKIGDKAVLNLNGLYIFGNAYDTSEGTTYASSLIGDVQGIGINLLFNNIKIDARNKLNVTITGQKYGTSKSIFSNATLLNRFDVDSTSVAIYNFSQAEDWGLSTVATKTNRNSGGKVTFGRELTDSVEYEDEENRYYESGENGNYIAPITYPGAYSSSGPVNSAYDFSSDYLPYVRYFTSDTTKIANPPAAIYTLREIKVNVVPSDLQDGCGTYDHPYSITGAKQLIAVSEMLDPRDTDTPIQNIMLPADKNDTSHWCLTDATTHSCKLFTYDGTRYTSSETSTTWEMNEVRKYLASAYYQIGQNLELGTSYRGLGAYNNSEYAFKGIIVGINDQITITNKTSVPFIKVSNGSVVKNLKITINNTGTFGATGNYSTAFGYSNSTNNLYYGGVIGEIMGGDNIIDNVSMTYSNSGFIKTQNSHLMCVGGYVGVIVNGGLIFRNMTADKFVSKSTFKVNKDGVSTATNWVSEDNTGHLYVNPYIGRVINGYAINETTTYSGDTDTYTLDNGIKNYQICDVKAGVTDESDATSEKLFYDTVTVNSASKYRVNIPTGQSLFILSLITQSGAGTATTPDGEYAYGVGYDGTVRYNNTSAAANTATHLAKYDNVGTITFANKTAPGSDYAVSTGDRLNDTTATPYIIYHYTRPISTTVEQVTTYTYPARMMTGNTEFMKLSTQKGTYNLPKSFRGIGSICRMISGNPATTDVQEDDPNSGFIENIPNDEDGKFAMKIYGFEGNDSTVNINLYYNSYANDVDNYNYTVYGKGLIHVGLGLFNYLKQKPNAINSAGNPNYNLTENYYVGNFTMTGTVKVSEYKSDGTNAGGDATNKSRFIVGGLSGIITENDYINLYKCDVNNLSVTGTSMVGGYIGRCNATERNKYNGAGMNYIYANGCNTTGLKVYGNNGYCGGFIAGSKSGYLSLYMNTAQNTKESDSDRRGSDGYYKSTMEVSVSTVTSTKECGTGGILGAIRNGYNVELWVNNVVLTGCSDSPKIENTENNVDATRGVGGFFGWVRKAKSVIITNSVVKNINITGPCAGGFLGYLANETNKTYFVYGQSPKISIYNCKVYDDDDENEYSITGVGNVGGIAGYFITPKTYTDSYTGYNGADYVYDIDGCEVYGYSIIQTKNDDNNSKLGSGGIIGYASTAQRTVVNTRVHDCTIKAGGAKTNHGMGGIVGTTDQGIWGYNIAAYNNVFAYYGDGTSARYGNLIGNSNSKSLKVAGFTRKNNVLETSTSTAVSQDYGNGAASGSYIIDADYMNISTTDAHGTSMAVGYDNGTNVSEGPAKNYFPYVTVTSKVGTGENNFLIGDGVSMYNASATTTPDLKPLAKLITTEYSGTAADNRIKYSNVASGDIATVNQMITWGEDTTADHDIKLTTYGNEMGLPAGYNGKDFPIIAVNGGETGGYNTYINAYIRTLTNTTDDYSVANASKYVVDTYPCQCISGVYKKVTGTAGFKLNAQKKFVMDNDHADSVAGNNQFTMIDISFKDPTDSTKTAYHLYIPVLTKKLLKFDFSSSALQGTEYEPSGYKAKFPETAGEDTKLAASFNSWQTVFVQFDYSKTEINEFLASGKGLNWNTSKTLYFTYNTAKSLAGSTQFVLLDNNNNVDKEYYIEKSGISTGINSAGNAYDIVEFSRFKTKNNVTFTPQLLKDIAADKLIYTQDNNGAYVACGESDATVIVNEGSTPKYFKAGTSGTKYKIELKPEEETLSETYYLSMYTFDKDNTRTSTTHDAYGFIVECPLTFSSSVITCQRNSAKNTQIFLGNFLKQTLTIREINQNPVISTTNYNVWATLHSTVEFFGDNIEYFNSNLAGETLYQGYMFYLEEYDEDGHIVSDSTIKGQPNYSYTRIVGGEPYGVTASGVMDEGEAYLYVEPIEIPIEYDPDETWSSVQEAKVNLNFGSDETKLLMEFPVKTSESDLCGIHISANAKLDFARDRVLYSNIVKKGSYADTERRYYIDRTNNNGILTITALEQSENDEYDKYGKQSHNKSALGVNGKYLFTGDKYVPGENTEHIEASYDYDVSNLPEEMFNGDHKLIVTIVLEQKVNDDSEGYKYVPVKIEDYGAGKGYLENFKFIGKDGNPIALTRVDVPPDAPEPDYWYYMFETECSGQGAITFTDTGSQKHFIGNINFDVRTSEALEDIPGYLYSNYRLKVTTAVSDSTFSSEDWLVYTNAKMNAEYVKSSSTP